MPSPDEIEKLRQILAAQRLEPFIRHIRFPHFKNLEKDTRINFSYPITALVGGNGTNKSSVLRALQGAPGYKNLGNYWFSTSIDPIDEAGGRPAFIYGYRNAEVNEIVEVVKTRIQRDDDPDYWEPSRPLAIYGMTPPPPLVQAEPAPLGRTKTRWEAISKEVLYLDFRNLLSAFDKCFYLNDHRRGLSSEKSRKELIRRRAPILKQAIEQELESYSYYGMERITGENAELSQEAVAEISNILNRPYSRIRQIQHSFYGSDGFTCLMESKSHNYSEAFAGSGEFAVVRIVSSVLSAKEKSLILLDEPEVSIHPGAQMKLMLFLAAQVKKVKHQIVISTHSPNIIRDLPPDAIKVMSLDESSGRIRILKQESLPEEAFFSLGQPPSDKRVVYVEDELAKSIVKRSLQSDADSELLKMFQVEILPGGAQSHWNSYIKTFAAESRLKTLVLLDGDQDPGTALPDPLTIGEADDEQLQLALKAFTGQDITFITDGGVQGGSVGQQKAMRRKYVAWVRSNVAFLPGGKSPESFILENVPLPGEMQVGEDPKTAFVNLTRKTLDKPVDEQPSSVEILTIQRIWLAKIPVSAPMLLELRDKLKKFAAIGTLS